MRAPALIRLPHLAATLGRAHQRVPSGRPINPITKKDWEGTGVTPDVKVEADQALDAAKKLAIEKLHATPAPAK